MSRTRIMDIVTLTKNGWHPYGAKPDQAVYEALGCTPVRNGRRDRPFWFVRGDVFCCVGCAAHCTLSRPAGFPLPLPVHPKKIPLQNYSLTPREMLARLDLLNTKQAAYCLNVSERTIYNLIAEGKLVRLREMPVRVRAAEVKALCENFDE